MLERSWEATYLLAPVLSIGESRLPAGALARAADAI
jgi:hypothetical protein